MPGLYIYLSEALVAAADLSIAATSDSSIAADPCAATRHDLFNLLSMFLRVLTHSVWKFLKGRRVGSES